MSGNLTDDIHRENNEKAAVQHFAWIPSQILKSLHASLESKGECACSM